MTFIQEQLFENVFYKLSAIFSRTQYVNESLWLVALLIGPLINWSRYNTGINDHHAGKWKLFSQGICSDEDDSFAGIPFTNMI